VEPIDGGNGMTSSSEPSTVAARGRAQAPWWAQRVHAVSDYLTIDFLGGPRPLKFAWVIDFQKVGTFVLYGQSWQRKVTIGGAVNAFIGVLGWYWVFGWLLISGVSQPHYPLPDPIWFCLCISICMVGSAIMIAADAQKYFTLCHRRGLITDGMYRFIRHPNYLGEMLIYGSFAMMVWHWLPVLVLTWVWSGLFAVNMIMKEASMSRYPEWQAYRARTGWLLPKFVLTKLMNA
jgi:protein-S-isoprenylcysteine O-methyltransferase Ste14